MQYFFVISGGETRITESLSLIDAVTPDIVAARQNAHNAQKQAIKAEPGSGGEQNGVDVSNLYYEEPIFFLNDPPLLRHPAWW